MASPSLSLPSGLTLQTVTERLGSRGLSIVSRSSHEGASLRGVGGSYLVVTADELGQLRDLARQVESARKRAIRGHGSNISEQQKQEREQAVASLRQTRDLLVNQLRDEFTKRVLSVIKRSELIQEDYFTPSLIEQEASRSVHRTGAAPGTSQGAPPEEPGDWEQITEPTLEELEAAAAQPSQQRSCSIQ